MTESGFAIHMVSSRISVAVFGNSFSFSWQVGSLFKSFSLIVVVRCFEYIVFFYLYACLRVMLCAITLQSAYGWIFMWIHLFKN